jgi:hypothetical protein
MFGLGFAGDINPWIDMDVDPVNPGNCVTSADDDLCDPAASAASADAFADAFADGGLYNPTSPVDVDPGIPVTPTDVDLYYPIDPTNDYPVNPTNDYPVNPTNDYPVNPTYVDPENPVIPADVNPGYPATANFAVPWMIAPPEFPAKMVFGSKTISCESARNETDCVMTGKRSEGREVYHEQVRLIFQVDDNEGESDLDTMIYGNRQVTPTSCRGQRRERVLY